MPQNDRTNQQDEMNKNIRPQQNDNETENTQDNEKQSPGARRIDEQTNTSGYGSSQRNKRDNIGPLQSDLNELPSEKRRG